MYFKGDMVMDLIFKYVIKAVLWGQVGNFGFPQK